MTDNDFISVKDKDFGATADWANINDGPAFQRANDHLILNGGGGVVQIPRGIYRVTGVTVSPLVTFRGAGRDATVIITGYADETVFNLTGAYSGLEDMTILAKGVNNDTTTFGATKPAIVTSGGGQRLSRVVVHGGAPPISMASSDTIIDFCTFAHGFADSNIYFSTNTNGVLYLRNSVDQSWPVGFGPSNAAIGARKNSASYSVGDVATCVGPDGNVYTIQVTAITIGISGGAPPTLKNYDIDIKDGGVTWRLAGRSTLVGMLMTDGANEITIFGSDFSGAFQDCIRIEGAGAYSQICNNTFAGYTKHGIHLKDVHDMSIMSNHMIGGMSGSLAIYEESSRNLNKWGNSGYEINSVDGMIAVAPSSKTHAQFNLAVGGPPSIPIDGDIWRESTGIKVRENGVTKTIMLR